MKGKGAAKDTTLISALSSSFHSLPPSLSSGVLVPLFGLHNILAAFKPDAEESKIRIAIEVYSALSISFQV